MEVEISRSSIFHNNCIFLFFSFVHMWCKQVEIWQDSGKKVGECGNLLTKSSADSTVCVCVCVYPFHYHFFEDNEQ